MTVPCPERIELSEHRETRLTHDALTGDEGEELWRSFGNQVRVEFPTPRTGGDWLLTPRGWVGHLPLRSGRHVALRPKVPVGNLFRMLEVAYRLKCFRFLDGLVDLDSLSGYYDRIANVLAGRVLARARRGLHREYVRQSEILPYLRGRLDLREAVTKPWQVGLPCEFEEHTSDIEDNRILAWTLFLIARNSLCRPSSRPRIRRAWHTLAGAATLHPCSPLDCAGRTYTRLNEDYRTLHALCRFFLENCGPSHGQGSRSMLPFLVNMARLFELFVSEWLRAALPREIHLDDQHRFDITQGGEAHWIMDLVLRDSSTRRPLCVVDAKYKSTPYPKPADLAQVVAYAEALQCTDAVLLYPTREALPMDTRVGRIRVRSLVFELTGDLERAGAEVLAGLNGAVTVRASL